MSTTSSEALQRLERMIGNPDRYFDEARKESEAVVRAEMTREKQARARRNRRAQGRPSQR